MYSNVQYHICGRVKIFGRKHFQSAERFTTGVYEGEDDARSDAARFKEVVMEAETPKLLWRAVASTIMEREVSNLR